MFFREKIKLELCTQLKTRTFQQFFKSQSRQNPLLRSSSRPEDLILFLHNQDNFDYEQKDLVLASLVSEYQTDKKPLWVPLLSLIFWPAIETVFFAQRNQYIDEDDLFLEVYRAFCEVLLKYPVKRRPDKVAGNLKYEVLNLVCREQKKSCQYYRLRQLGRETGRVFKNHILSYSTPDITTLDELAEKPLTEKDYQNLLNRGAISETDYLLLLGTRIYGRSLKEVAREHNLGYETAKKRRQRAEQAAKELRKTE